ncbi:ABC transporter permease subunit [Mariniblastus sp.]|nr:ABC transporter permease subunit [Mariniblastus sp.]
MNQPTTSHHAVRPFSWWRLASKELRETLRDRRTIITLVLMPLLVYPILSLIFRTFLLSNAAALGTGEPLQYSIVCYSENGSQSLVNVLGPVGAQISQMDNWTQEGSSEDNGGIAFPGRNVSLSRFHEHQWQFLDGESKDELVSMVESGEADVGLVVTPGTPQTGPLGTVQMFTRPDGRSQEAASYLRRRSNELTAFQNEQQLKRAGLSSRPMLEFDKDVLMDTIRGPSKSKAKSFSLASLVPLILVLMTITGAVYPAIDLTAGERERGTLETLMAAPIPRASILMSKFIAVLTVAVMTALLNLVGMAATIWTFQLDQFLPGDASFTLLTMVKVLGLLVLFAAFFSAVLLAVTSYAKSFKEAQAYLVPIILLSLGPGLMAMFPGLELAGTLAITPMMNILLLARDVIENTVQMGPALIAISSTVLYAGIAIWVAARTFGSSSMLYSNQGSVSELFQRPDGISQTLQPAAALGCMALLFPVNFVMIGVLGRLSTDTSADLAARFTIMGAFTVLAFVAIPYLIASHQRANLSEVFGLKMPRTSFLVIGLVLGLTLWPLVASLIEVYGRLGGEEAHAAWQKTLVAETSDLIGKIRKVSPITVGVFLSLVPAFCEEFFFRGMLMRSLARWRTAGFAIVFSAVVFGLFHVLSNSVIALDRLLPTAMVGLVLGYLAWKSDSIFPGVILHSLHNAAVVFLGYYQPKLQEFAWFPDESQSLPWTWVVASGICVAFAMLVLFRMKVDSGQEETYNSDASA